jgi:redox-sensitive bicupin YhaK (pirin superfamily)
MVKKIQKVWKSKPTIEGAGVHLKRAFGYYQVPELDPFLLLDDFHSDNPDYYLAGFPWHPHRGIETITYVLQGTVEHGDSMGNSGIISPGDVQWMTAGSGIIHQEMPKGSRDKILQGFQLWANLPAKDKMMAPRYRGITHNEIPEKRLASGAGVKVICGTVDGVTGPVHDIVAEPEYIDVSVPAGTTFIHPVSSGHTVFAYVIAGSAYFDDIRNPFAHEAIGENYFDFKRDCRFGAESLVLYERQGEEIEIKTEESSVRFLLVSGNPIGEPVAWYGPIVMNTQEELQVAFDEFEKGTFIKYYD